LLGAVALLFDAMTPAVVSVGLFYAAVVLAGFWFPKPNAELALALLATLLVIVGYWITIPDNTPEWEVWTNRALAIGTVWLLAIFVGYIRALEQTLQQQIELTNCLSREMEHRIGNHLQLVASFLRLQAASSCNEEARCALELAGSRLTVVGKIQRMLSHSTASRAIDSKAFISALVEDVRSALADPDKVEISVRADSAELTSLKATALGALLVELINNALKHAFRGGIKGRITVSFTASNNHYTVGVEDDGLGIDQEQTDDGFGRRNITELARLMGGSISCQPVRQSDTRPGTMWRLVIPA
jgi:two-component sensor histidine kinase